ncbi:hypothetical protein Tdes44962_MAKER06748 [Teratosphaeria destructans]|uniref:Uncharacterized protein n=1 Tax=Teratosphaeria destructans TaxID=418781 RepID=A0A9W7W761_9PEZI|nr:hypothetical protein Tdes44962_MAKER06748 [Teratosphaeria destructans]
MPLEDTHGLSATDGLSEDEIQEVHREKLLCYNALSIATPLAPGTVCQLGVYTYQRQKRLQIEDAGSEQGKVLCRASGICKKSFDEIECHGFRVLARRRLHPPPSHRVHRVCNQSHENKVIAANNGGPSDLGGDLMIPERINDSLEVVLVPDWKLRVDVREIWLHHAFQNEQRWLGKRSSSAEALITFGVDEAVDPIVD